MKQPDELKANVFDIPEEEKFLKKLLIRNFPQDYLNLIQNVSLETAKSEYSELLEKELKGISKEDDEFLNTKFKDGVVLDLACGTSHAGSRIAKNYGAKTYLGIDLDPVSGASRGDFKANRPLGVDKEDQVFATTNKDANESGIITLEEPKIAQLSYEPDGYNLRIKSDMLSLIARLEDSSINVVIVSGVEGRFDSKLNGEYLSALEKEIKRVLRDGGICLIYHSDIMLFGIADFRKCFDIEGKLYRNKLSVYEKTADSRLRDRDRCADCV